MHARPACSSAPVGGRLARYNAAQITFNGGGVDGAISTTRVVDSTNFSAVIADLVFATGASEVATEKMRILSDGKVGIGTDAPSATLEVAGDLVARRTQIITITGNTNLSGVSNAGRLLRCTSACTLSLQASPTAGEQQIIYNDSSGTITIAANGSDTINGSTDDITITTRYRAITFIAVSASAWLAIGA